MEQYVVGVDLGGTKIATGLCSIDGKVLQKQRLPTGDEDGLDAVVDRIVESVVGVVQGVDLNLVRGVGLGAPGPVDTRAGIVSYPPNLKGWRDVPLRDLISLRLPSRLGHYLPVILGNDANAAGLAEFRFGAGSKHTGLRHLVYITVGTGIGGAIVVDGKIFEGARGLAGEFGHTTIDIHGPPCDCGNIGCAEVLAAGPAIERAGAALVRDGRAPRLSELVSGDPAKVTGQLVKRAADDGDTDTRALVAQIGGYLGVLVVNVLHMFNPEIVVIGGGVSKLGDLILDPIRAVVEDRALPAAKRGLFIERAMLGDDVGVLGAASLLL